MIALFPYRTQAHGLGTSMAAAWAAAFAVAGTPARADGTLELTAVRPLDFGALVVLGNGTKEIAPDGTASASGVATVGHSREGAAEFTLAYRPGNGTRTAVVLLSLNAPGRVAMGGAVGNLSNLATDLPALAQVTAGTSNLVTLQPCPPPVCVTTFHVGGRLTVSGGSADAAFSFPLQLTARLVQER